MCNYFLKDTTHKNCEEKSHLGSEFCILHLDFPENKDGDEFKKIIKLKEEKIREKIAISDYNFEGAILANITLKDLKIDANLIFNNAQIWGDAWFQNLEISHDSHFSGAHFYGGTSFIESKVEMCAVFEKTIFENSCWFGNCNLGYHSHFIDCSFGEFTSFSKTIFGNTQFKNAIFKGQTGFSECLFKGPNNFENVQFGRNTQFGGNVFENETNFKSAKFSGFVSFDKAKFNEFSTIFDDANFDTVSFNGAQFNGDLIFTNAHFGNEIKFSCIEITGILNCENTTFKLPAMQELLCRTAKQNNENLGDRSRSDQYFFREMEAKRLQKSKILSFFEWFFVQEIFGYGVKPWRLFTAWIVFICFFSVVYYTQNGIENIHSIMDYIWLSVTTAVTPGFGGINPKPDIRIITTIEAILGTFLWAGFIATFARRYMR